MPKASVSVKPSGRKKKDAKTCCNICLDDKYKRRMARLDCGHYYCKSCIKKWAKQQNTCPQCRARFTHIGQRRVQQTSQRVEEEVWDQETVRETMELIFCWINDDVFKEFVMREIAMGNTYYIHVLNRILAGMLYFRNTVPRHISNIFDYERDSIDMHFE